MSVRETIRRELSQLTTSERKIGSAVLADYPFGALQTIQELAERTGVSAPSITRFVSKIGFGGYQEFQRQLISELREGGRSPLDLKATERLGDKDTFLADYARRAAERLGEMADDLAQDQFDRIVALVADPTRNVFLLGGRVSDSIAALLAIHLKQIRPRVHQLPADPERWPDQLLQMRKQGRAGPVRLPPLPGGPGRARRDGFRSTPRVDRAGDRQVDVAYSPLQRPRGRAADRDRHGLGHARLSRRLCRGADRQGFGGGLAGHQEEAGGVGCAASRPIGQEAGGQAVIGEEMIVACCTDLAGKVRGKAFPASQIDKRLRRGVGWTPTNVQITCFDLIAESPFGSLGDLVLMPDEAARVRVDFGDGSPSSISRSATSCTPTDALGALHALDPESRAGAA